ncbi:hypothetical protein R1flu_013685 [Riccia fluitans]|uniref:Uncharacterized protein n=1 Tax=Riccia fluitans TaxID=41844 RepID=A0ABD1YDX8_9MARC
MSGGYILCLPLVTYAILISFFLGFFNSCPNISKDRQHWPSLASGGKFLATGGEHFANDGKDFATAGETFANGGEDFAIGGFESTVTEGFVISCLQWRRFANSGGGSSTLAKSSPAAAKALLTLAKAC